MESNFNQFHSFTCSTEVNKILHKSDSHLITNDHRRRRSAHKTTSESISFPNTIEESDSIEKSIKDVLTGKTTTRQKLVLCLLAYGNLLVSACVSLQAPFFPREAELKGATPTQYGFVFGIYELVIAMTAPLFGMMIASVSSVFLCEIGLLISGLSTIVFGLLDMVPEGAPFISLCFLIRIIEGISASAFMTASYVIMAKEFPDSVATTFSILETAFGVGLIIGPTLGGGIYELGGYYLPFIVLGTFLLLGGVFTFILMPKSSEETVNERGNMLKFMADAGIILDALAIATALNFIGFNSATLEPHLRQFDLSPAVIGCIFIISGGIYAVTTVIWGKLCDKGADPKKICLIGSLLCIAGFVFIGPLSFIPIKPQLWLIIVSLVLIGFGTAAKLVSAFISSLHDSTHRRGFPDDITTYGLVSAMFFSACSVGAFIGPSIGGFLLEHIGYRHGTIVILASDVIMALLLITYITQRSIKKRNEDELRPLLRG